MTQGDINETALLLSGIALVIAILSAAFTGWEAITAHLARTQPRKAHWAIDYAELDQMAGVSSWYLVNTGGSLGTDVKLEVTFLKIDAMGEEVVWFPVVGVVQPNERAVLADTQKRVDPRMMILKREDNRFAVVSAGTEGAWYSVEQWARVTWRGYRGRNRSAKIPLR
jgi:hypothetical protein